MNELARLQTVFDYAFSDCPQIDINTSQADVTPWDSMGHLVLILELEKEFGVSFEVDQIERMTSVQEILKCLGEGRESA